MFGAYAPEVQVSPEQEKEVHKAQRALKSLSAAERQLFLAYKLGLLFCTSYDGYSSSLDERFAPESGLYGVLSDVRVVLPNGKEVAYKDATKKIAMKKWEEAGRIMAQVGDHAVCAAFAKEVTALVKALAHRHLSHLPPVHRDAFLALLEEDAVLDKDGKPAKAEDLFIEDDVPGMHNEKYKRPITTGFRRDEKFIFRDRDGKERDLESTLKVLWDRDLAGNFDQLFWCVKLIGARDVVDALNDVENREKKKK